MITPGTYVFAAADYGKPVVITWTGSAAASYAPNLTPVYALTDLDFVDEKGNKDPVQVERADVFSLPTIQRLEVSSRSNQYCADRRSRRATKARSRFTGRGSGRRSQAHEICDEFVIGPIVAQTILQRALYVRTKFKFKLSWEYCLLDPMDIVTITDANLGLSNYPVRIIEIEEDDKGLLAITAEELVTGVSTPAFYPNASAPAAMQQNSGVPAVPVNAPLIFQPPLALTGGVAQVWVGASGSFGGGGSQWGGANVYVSVDDVTYSQIAVITAPMRQGVLTASLAAAADGMRPTRWRSTCPRAAGRSRAPAQAAAQAGATLSLVDSEFLAYETATLVSGNAYSLTGLARGLGGSSPAGHSTGAAFFRLDGAVLRYDLPANLVGQTLYFKFQSFNVFGGGLQDLSTCAVYTFNAAGGARRPTRSPPSSRPASRSISARSSRPPTLADDFGPGHGRGLRVGRSRRGRDHDASDHGRALWSRFAARSRVRQRTRRRSVDVTSAPSAVVADVNDLGPASIRRSFIRFNFGDSPMSEQLQLRRGTAVPGRGQHAGRRRAVGRHDQQPDLHRRRRDRWRLAGGKARRDHHQHAHGRLGRGLCGADDGSDGRLYGADRRARGRAAGGERLSDRNPAHRGRRDGQLLVAPDHHAEPRRLRHDQRRDEPRDQSALWLCGARKQRIERLDGRRPGLPDCRCRPWPKARTGRASRPAFSKASPRL